MKTTISKLWVWALLIPLSGITAYANEPIFSFVLTDPYRDVADFEMWECKDERAAAGALLLVAMNAKGTSGINGDAFGYHKRGFIFDIQYGVRFIATDFYAQRVQRSQNGELFGESFTIRTWRIKTLIGDNRFIIEEQPHEPINYKGSYLGFDYPDHVCTKISQHKLIPNRTFGDQIPPRELSDEIPNR